MVALDYARELVSFESTSVLSNVEVSDYVQQALKSLSFDTERIDYTDNNGVPKANIIGKLGAGVGGVAHFSHTDVVPATTWFSEENGPFSPFVQDEKLYGRGSCDMKGSLACFLAAVKQTPASQLIDPVYVVCTADEEVGYCGAAEVASRSELYREMVANGTKGIIGEPTLLEVVYAHKGTCGFQATSRGVAAHSSTSKGKNANLAMIPFLAEMKRIHDEVHTDPAWQNEEFTPPIISWNIGINDHTAAVNITPPQSICTVYFRIMPGQSDEELVRRAHAAAAECGLEFEMKFRAKPFYVSPDSEFAQQMLSLTGQPRPRTVAYGTDAAMFMEMKHLVVCGPGDIAQAHTKDEWIALSQLEAGTDLYRRVIEDVCG